MVTEISSSLSAIRVRKTARRAKKSVLRLHLYLGLASAVVLIVLGLTGSILAFQGDIDRWINPGLSRVESGSRLLPEEELVRAVERRTVARVAVVQMPQDAGAAQIMRLAKDGLDINSRQAQMSVTQVFVDPYTGSLLGKQTGRSRIQRVVDFAHTLHESLAVGAVGRILVTLASLALCVEVPLGLYLWLQIRRASIRWNASWFRICFDVHNTIGIFVGLLIFVVALTGVLMGLTPFFIRPSPDLARPPRSKVVAGRTPITIDQAIAAARDAAPNSKPVTVQLPLTPQAPFNISMRGSVGPSAFSFVSVDQYSGKVLLQHEFGNEPPAMHLRLWARLIHTGEIFGLSSRLIVSLVSLLLVIEVFTGTVIWWKKLAR